jgi:hypothetical protein
MIKLGASIYDINKSGFVDLKKLTYFLILFLLLASGMTFSKTAHDLRSMKNLGNCNHEFAEKANYGFSAFNQNDPQTDFDQTLGNNQPLSEKLSNYLIKNYILSNSSSPFAENTRRTSIWFTSRLKN